MSAKPNCYECTYRRGILGDAHSRCAHPTAGGDNNVGFEGLDALSLFLNGGAPLGVTAVRHGVEMGWFTWPINFDPVWLLTCDGFTAKDGSGDRREQERGR